MQEKLMTAYEDLQFAPLGEGSPAEAALLWGDPATGPAALLVRFPEAYAEPWHSHSAAYRAVLMKGEFQFRNQDTTDSDTVYRPGSFVVQPGGMVHSEVNAGPGDLVALGYKESRFPSFAFGENRLHGQRLRSVASLAAPKPQRHSRLPSTTCNQRTPPLVPLATLDSPNRGRRVAFGSFEGPVDFVMPD